MTATRRFVSIGLLVVLGAAVGGCPIIPPEPTPEAVLEGDWTTDSGEGVIAFVRFDENGIVTTIFAILEDGTTVQLEPDGSTTALDGNDVTITFTTDNGEVTFEGTLSDDENTLEGTLTRTIEIGGDGGSGVITIPEGDVTLVRVDCTADEDCAEGEVCTDGECVAGQDDPLHKTLLESLGDPNYQGTQTCLTCHSDHAADIMETAHWNWSGAANNIAGLEDETHGKVDLINNFCVSLGSNEGRCTQCHISYGWKSGIDEETFFNTPENIDCLICHDTTGTYRKHASANGGGGPASLLVEGEVVPVTEMSELNGVAYNVGTPSRTNCGLCHYFAGGDNNVKHGDLSTDLNEATNDQDVHMGGLDYTCQQCHVSQDHKIAGTTALHSDEGEVACTDCHNEADLHSANPLYNNHLDRVACQVCHIPAFARTMATNVAWYWDEAGEDREDIPLQFERSTYSKKKGRFEWDMNVTPSYRWFDGEWARKVVNVSDTYTEAGTEEDPVVLAAPTATAETEGAMIYPFKRMIGRQPADPINQRMLVPHLFGTGPGPDPYWISYDWGLALAEGAAYAGQDYSGEYAFVNTLMYMSINHEVAPATEALQCANCHGNADFWEHLGIDDPTGGS